MVGLAVGLVLWCVRIEVRVARTGGLGVGGVAGRAHGCRQYQGTPGVVPAAAAVLVALSGLAGVAVGPLVAEGPARAFGPERSAALMRFATRASTLALIGGSALGAAAGLVVGAFAYLPTAPFAAIAGRPRGGRGRRAGARGPGRRGRSHVAEEPAVSGTRSTSGELRARR